jgi:hypothetical protein
VADDSVVVINPLPMKAGDRLEDKTKETIFLVILEFIAQKVINYAKG